MRLLIPIIGFILLGVTLEVFWTAILNHFKEKRKSRLKLIGKTYLWMFPIYALIPFIYLIIIHYFSNMSIFLRGLIYLFLFYVLEFSSGFIIKKIVGNCPWNYSEYKIKIFGKEFKSNLNGIICLQYAPVWYVYGILGELYYLFLIGI